MLKDYHAEFHIFRLCSIIITGSNTARVPQYKYKSISAQGPRGKFTGLPKPIAGFEGERGLGRKKGTND